tara:strand:- start:368 stop:667 length:300 start_codon:yes stop_codon:yes gene_type:complete
MPDSSWLLAIRERRYNATKKAILAKNGKDFTAVSLIPEVKRHVWSHERWDISKQVIVGALKRLRREGLVVIVGEERIKKRNKLYPTSIYRAVGNLFEEE